MITKAIVEAIVDTYSFRVRIPVINRSKDAALSTPTEELYVSSICTVAGCIPNVRVGDIVYVSFEDNDLSKPVILGYLYKDSYGETLCDFEIGNLTVDGTTNLSYDTYIGDVKPNEIDALQGARANIQWQLDLHEKDIELLKAGSDIPIEDRQANWTETDPASISYIRNKPTIPTKTSDLVNDGSDGTAAYLETDETAYRTSGIPYGQVDSTSTSTAYTATVPGITELRDGVCMLLKNGVVTSAASFTININGLGAKPSYNNMTTGNAVTPTLPTRDTTIFNINYTMFFIYSEDIVSGGGWICYRGYDANTNTLGYQLRTNNTTLPASAKFYRYRLLFTSADGTKWVPANTSTSTNATARRDTIQTPIDPFGSIVWYGTTTVVNSGDNVSATQLWQQYYSSSARLGYSFNRTNAAQTLIANRAIYIKCTPQNDGSAIIDADEPFVQSLPNTEDGKIYIFLGRATHYTSGSTTYNDVFEIMMVHPVYFYKNGAIRAWTNQITTEDVDTVPSAYCATAADIASKTATCTGYTLTANTYVHVLMRNANSSASALTLSIGSATAKPIYINGTATSSTNYTLPAGTYIVHYDGTAYQFRTDGKLPGKILDSDHADLADEVEWTGIRNRPTLSYASIDSLSPETLNIIDI